MSVPTADQIRLSKLLSDDLQLRINWAYNLEQEIATLSGGGLTSWGLASQATYVHNGDPNGLVTAVSIGDFLIDVATPALWIAAGAGTVWTQATGGGGGAPTGAAGGDLGGTYPNPTVPALTEIEIDIGALEAAVSGPATIPESAITNLTSDLAAKASATLAVGGDLTGNLPNPTLATAGPGATGPLGTASRIPVIAIDAKGRVTGLSDIAALLAATGDATGNLPGALTLKNTGPGATGPLGTAVRVPVVTIDAQGRTTALTDIAIALAATGDATGTLPGALTLKNTGPGATGPSGSATVVPVVTIDAQGRVTALTTATIAIPESAVTNLTTDLAAKAPIASPTFTGTVTLPGDPASALQAATKQYVDAAIQGLSPKPSVLTATTANLTLSGEQTIDGQLTSTSRVLVKNQTAPAENGIYVTAAGAWARATDFDAPAEIPGAFVFVEKGTAQGATGWTVASAGPFVVGTTAIVWTQFSGAGTYAAGTGISLTGSSFSIDTAVTVDKTTAQTLTNKTLTSPAIATPTGLVKGDVGLGNVDNTSNATERAASATLTNKKLSDTTTTVVNAADATKVAKVDLSGATTGKTATLAVPVTNDRTITFPDATDTLVGKATTDTLTNKSIDAAQLTGTIAIARVPTGTDGTHVPLGGVITGAGPTGDASHTLALTYNAAGQLTAVTNNAIAIAESQVTNLTTDLGALQTQTTVQAAQVLVFQAADQGQFVCTGGALTPNATPTKLDLAAGTDFMATTEFTYAAQTAIATTIASLADATNPKWVVIELDSAGVVQFNQGTAAASPAIPALTAARTVHGFLYVPANATNVDALLTTNNGLAKLIDARALRTVHPSRRIATDISSTALTNPVSLSTTVAAGSNNVHTNTFAGSGTLNVASTTGFPTAGVINVLHVATQCLIAYTGTAGGNSFTGCTLLNGVDVTMATSDVVTAWWDLLNAGQVTIPANSLTVGDMFRLTASGTYTNNNSASTLEIKVTLNQAAATINVFDYVTASLNTSASARRWSLDITFVISATGASATGLTEGMFMISAPAAGASGVQVTSGAGAGGDMAAIGAGFSNTTASTAQWNLALQAIIGTSSAAATVGLRNFSIEKIPV